jgi:glyoxylase-like metal-dependent hydrolase (beta-lactamase superfamily II)/predicted ester cyclase
MSTTSSTSEDTEHVVRSYFGGMEDGARGNQREWYAEDAVLNFYGQGGELDKPSAIAYFEEMWAAIPDWSFEIVDLYASGEHATVHWHITGTFAGPGQWQGFEPNGAALDFYGADVVKVGDGKVKRIDVYTDGMTIARQLGALPPVESPMQDRMAKAFNARVRLTQKLGRFKGPEEVADGVWLVQGDPGRCSVYFLRDGDGVTMFDAGAKVMLSHVRSAAAQLGGLKRIVLGHGHTDHRGTAPYLGVPVYCHPDEVVDAEGSGGWRYWPADLKFLPPPLRVVHKQLHKRAWDGGPVQIAGTVSEGDDVCGFQVLHTPGHAPGLISLWRESDRVAIVGDLLYTTDMWGRDDDAHVPTDGYNFDTAQARESIRKVAALSPSVAWPGHAEPVRGDVRSALERAASA